MKVDAHTILLGGMHSHRPTTGAMGMFFKYIPY